MVWEGFLFPIFKAYTLNNFLLGKQLDVDLGQDLVLGALLIYIVMLISSDIVLYSLYIMISSVCVSK